MTYKNFLKKLNTPQSEPRNESFNSAEMEEWKKATKGQRDKLAHDYDNRAKRRNKGLEGVINNRRNPKKRAKVAEKMAYFALSLMGKHR